jgi:hypothetical protein
MSAALLTGVTLLGTTDAAVAVDAALSTASVAAGAPVILTLADDAPLPTNIDLTPLAADFQVIEQRRAEAVSRVDGRRTERHELILTLLPRRTGALAVPPVVVGEETTPALALSVAEATNPAATLVPASAAAPAPAPTAPLALTLDADATPRRVVVGQEVLVVVRALSPDAPPRGRMPTPSAENARLLLLGEQRRVDGDGRHVFEQRYALFPQRAGRLRIDNLGFDAWNPGGGAPRRERTAALEIEVTAPPAAAQAETWLPARSLTLMEAGPSEVRIAPGQGIERVLTLRAEGLMAEDLPAIPMQIPFSLRVRDDPPRLWNERTPEGVIGYRSERVLVSPDESGSYRLPGPSVEWWDSAAGQSRTATLPDWTLTVAPFASADRRPAARWERDAIAADGLDSATAADVAPTQRDDASTHDARGWPPGAPWWFAGAGLSALLAMAAVTWLARRRRQRPLAAIAPVAAAESSATTASTAAASLAAVRAAYAKADAAGARSALLAWAAQVWAQTPPGNLSQLMLRLEPPLRDDIKLLDKAFYGPGDDAWAACPVPARLSALSADAADGPGAAPGLPD